MKFTMKLRSGESKEANMPVDAHLSGLRTNEVTLSMNELDRIRREPYLLIRILSMRMPSKEEKTEE